ncbi:IS110 family transposase [Geodermatophilus sp. SYSU D01176]
MRIVGGLDVHRRQITFDYLDERTGQHRRGRIAPADRMLLRHWLKATVEGAPAAFAVEACTGWQFVVEELQRAGVEAHLAEPADTAAAREPKRRAKTDRTDARHLRQLLAGGRLPESWIPPEQVLETRAKLELFKDLREAHTAWVQRIHAILLHQGAPAIAGDLLGADNRRRLEAGEQLSAAGRQAVATALRMLDAVDAELVPLRREIAACARRQPGCKALQAHHGVGEITAAALWAELGDTRRFSTSRKTVRHTGLNITAADPAGRPGRLRATCSWATSFGVGSEENSCSIRTLHRRTREPPRRPCQKVTRVGPGGRPAPTGCHRPAGSRPPCSDGLVTPW